MGRGHPKGIGWQTKQVVSRLEIEELISTPKESLDKAFMALLYLTGGRIREVLELRDRDIQEDEEFYEISIITLKVTKRPYKCKKCGMLLKGGRISHLFRDHQVEVDKAVTDKMFSGAILAKYFEKDKRTKIIPPIRTLYIPKTESLMAYIEEYRKTLRDEVKEKAPNLFVGRTWKLFPQRKIVFGWMAMVDYTKSISKVQGWKIVKRYEYVVADRVEGGKIFPHWFRHQRDTHLAKTPYRFTDFELQAFRGSVDIRSSAKYVHIAGSDLRERMKGKGT